MAEQLTDDDYAASARNVGKYPHIVVMLDSSGIELRDPNGNIVATSSIFLASGSESASKSTFAFACETTAESRVSEDSIIVLRVNNPKTKFEVVDHMVFSDDEKLAEEVESWLKMSDGKHIKKMVTLPSYEGPWGIDLTSNTGNQKSMLEEVTEEDPKPRRARKATGAAAKKAVAKKAAQTTKPAATKKAAPAVKSTPTRTRGAAAAAKAKKAAPVRKAAAAKK